MRTVNTEFDENDQLSIHQSGKQHIIYFISKF